jgi:phospholipid/cholesterol/gamma-HCH transport system substrate-binding protein
VKRLRTKLIALACALSLTIVAGCGFSGIYDVPLPGGADVGDHPYRVTVQFRDVLDLVPQAGVRVNEVPVGRVESIGLADDGWTAEVTVLVNGDVTLPANAVANLRQSSLLGEKYVELSAPAKAPAEATLGQGDVIPVARTNRSVEVEEVLGALSMLLNGGGVEQLNTISRELNKAMSGNEPDIKALLHNADELVSTLDEQSADITRALDSLNRLSSTLNQQRNQIVNAVDHLGPGLRVLEQQRGQLVTMLHAMDELSDVAVHTVNASQEDLVANLEALLPTLRKLGEAGSDLPKALQLMLTYPFTDAAVEGAKGDYFNLYVKLDLDLEQALANLSRSRQNPLQNVPIVGGLTGGQDGGNGQVPLPLPSSGSGGAGSDGESKGLGGLLGILSGGEG